MDLPVNHFKRAIASGKTPIGAWLVSGAASTAEALGCVGFEGCFQYSVTGTVANLAAHLCDQAKSGEILIDSKVHAAVESMAELEPVGELALKGLHRPVLAFNVRELRS